MNAPTAAPKPWDDPAEVASSAAPGVDHAIVIGIRVRQAKRMQPRPIVTDTIARPEAAWLGDAPSALRPVSTTANEPVKPTTADTMPARIAWLSRPSVMGSVEVVTG